jgi:hypothetical protein
MQVCGELHVAVYTYLLLREALQAAILLHVSQAYYDRGVTVCGTPVPAPDQQFLISLSSG